jgi:hypothetical protein
LSKKQITVETSVFGAEFVALKVGIETMQADPMQAQDDGSSI